MILDGGTVYICELVNTAPNGRKPVFKLVKKNKHWFAERTVGYSRYYEAKGVNEQIDMLIRVHHDRSIRIGMYAMLGNGEQYHIDQVQQIVDDDNGLRYTDLTLSRIEEYYELDEQNI